MIVKFEGNLKDVPVTQVTPENYIVPEKEKHVYHTIIEVKKFNAETGERLSKPRVQKFGAKSFRSILNGLKRQGYTVTVLYDPTEYNSKNKQTLNANKSAKESEEIKRLKEELEALKQMLAEQSAEKSEKRKKREKKEETKEEAE